MCTTGSAGRPQLPGPFKWRLLIKALQLAGPACLEGLEESRDAILFAASVAQPALLRVVTAWMQRDGEGEEGEGDEGDGEASNGDDSDGDGAADSGDSDGDAELVVQQALSASFYDGVGGADGGSGSVSGSGSGVTAGTRVSYRLGGLGGGRGDGGETDGATGGDGAAAVFGLHGEGDA